MGAWSTARPDVVVIHGTQSEAHHAGLVFYKGTSWAFDPGMITSGKPAVVVGATCHLGQYAHNERAGTDTPVPQDLMLHFWEGAIAQIGPTAASWASGDRIVVGAFVDEMLASVGSPLAEAWRAVVQDIIQDNPNDVSLLRLVRSFQFLGDPLSRLRSGGGPTTDVGASSPNTLKFLLESVRPNPALSSVSVDFVLERSTEVRVSVFDVRGRRVAVLLDARRDAGRHSVSWNRSVDGESAVASGVYFVRFEAEGVRDTKKIVLFR